MSIKKKMNYRVKSTIILVQFCQQKFDFNQKNDTTYPHPITHIRTKINAKISAAVKMIFF